MPQPLSGNFMYFFHIVILDKFKNMTNPLGLGVNVTLCNTNRWAMGFRN